MQITIASIQTNAPKMGTVQTTDGRKINFWKSELGKLGLQGNGTYEVETEPYHDRTLITKATPINGAAPPPAAVTNGHGNGHYRPTAPQDAERMLVTSWGHAFIRTGQIEPNEEAIVKMIGALRRAYAKTFGFDDKVFTPSEAGRKVA